MSNEKLPATLDDVVSSIGKLQNSIDDAVTWLKISGVEKVKNLLEKELEKPEKILTYHYSIEDKSVRDIKELSGAGLGTISGYQTAWFNLGLMKKVPIRGKDRYVKNFNLEDFGINIPNHQSNEGEKK